MVGKVRGAVRYLELVKGQGLFCVRGVWQFCWHLCSFVNLEVEGVRVYERAGSVAAERRRKARNGRIGMAARRGAEKRP